jgi:uncharacterized membrane protein YcaP (DUF421 family)
VAQGAVATTAIYLAVIAMTRIAGQRSLASLTTFDFAVSVAIGAVIGRVSLVATTLLGGIVALATLFLSQTVVGYLRNRRGLSVIVDNDPIVVFADGRFLPEEMDRAHVASDDILERLRLGGVLRLDDVRAVVMERSGRMSVLRNDEGFDARLLHSVPNRGVVAGVPESRESLPGMAPERPSRRG